MGTLLVTITGARRRDMAVPDDLVVHELLPELLEACGPPPAIRDAQSWSLGLAGRTPLGDDESLHEAGVVDGDVLYIRESGPWSNQLTPGHEPRAHPPDLDLTTILPPLLTAGQRVASAARALVGRGPRTAHAPAGWTAPVARARANWHESGYQQRLDAVLAGPRPRRCVTIAVVGPKRGVGTTTATVVLGTLLARLRGERVVAVDASPGPGSLTRLFGLEGQSLLTGELLDAPSHPDALPPPIHRRLLRGEHALRVLPGSDDASEPARRHEEIHAQALSRLQHLADVILVDCSAGLHSPATRAAIAAADQIVLMADLEPATGGVASEAAELLAKTGAPIVLMVNRTPSSPDQAGLQELAARVPRASAVVVLPDDPAAAAAVTANDFTWEAAPEAWRIAVREDLVVLMAHWGA